MIDYLSHTESSKGQPPGWFSLFPSTSLLILPIVPFPRLALPLSDDENTLHSEEK
jgi:hypothetical protein